MITRSNFRLWTLAVVAAALALAVGTSVAQVKKGKSRLVTTKQVMKGIVKPHCDLLKKGLEAAPADDKAWDELALHAAVINEITFTLMDDGRCPDGTWADAASKVMRQGSADLAKAAEAKDYAAAKTAFGAMGKSCKACHDAHKKKE